MNSFVLCNSSGSYKVRWKITLLHPLFRLQPATSGYASRDLREGIHFSSAPAGVRPGGLSRHGTGARRVSPVRHSRAGGTFPNIRAGFPLGE